MNWSEVTARALVEAVEADRRDVVLFVGDDDDVAAALAARVGTLVRAPDLSRPPPGLSVVCLHDRLHALPPAEQRAVFGRAAHILPQRGLLVIGGVMFSLPVDQVDAPEQFGRNIEHAQTTSTLERWAREAGFLPDVHRFGVGAGLLIGVRT